jgi:Tfp pilus assembly protein PilF
MSRATGVSILCALAGCHTTHEQAKEEATQHWSRLRAEFKTELASGQLDAGQFDAASVTLEQAYALDPTLPELTPLLAKVHLANGRVAQAEQFLDGATTTVEHRAEIDYLRGIIAQQRQRWRDALAFFQSASDNNPHEVAYLVAVSESLLQLGRPSEALEHLEQHEDEFGWTQGYQAARAECYEQLGRWTDAASCWRQVADTSTHHADIRERLAIALYRAGRFVEAVPVFNELLADGGIDASVTLRLAAARCLIEDNQLSAAHTQVTVVLERDERNLRAQHLRARIFAEQHEFQRAFQVAHRALRIAPDDIQSLELASALATRNEDLALARELAARLLDLQPGNPVGQRILDTSTMPDNP